MNKLGIICSLHPFSKPYHSQCINSFNAQTDKDFLLILFNDGANIPKSVSKQIEVISNKVTDLSPGKIKEKGVRIAQESDCDYIAIIDSDDTMVANRVEQIKNYIGVNYSYSFIHNLNTIDENDNILKKDIFDLSHDNYLFDFFLNKNISGFGNTIYKVEDIFPLIPFPEDVIALDWYLAVFIAMRNGFSVLNESLVNYRQHGGNIAGINENYTPEKLNNLIKIRDLHYHYLLKDLFDNGDNKNYYLDKIKNEKNYWENKKKEISSDIRNYLSIMNDKGDHLLWHQII